MTRSFDDERFRLSWTLGLVLQLEASFSVLEYDWHTMLNICV